MKVGAFLGVVLASATASAADFAERVDAIAKHGLSHPVAGISVAVARDGKVVFARGYGFANLEHSVPVTPETVFHIASISKNIEAAVIVQLAERGKLNLDEDVTKYVPEAPTHGKHVTVRQLINHTSGIFSFTSLPNAMQNERLDLDHQQVLALIKDKPFDFEPGTSWRYDNSAFYIAGMVVERVTKQDYATYVRDHIFQPLGMTSAMLCDARMVVPHLASGYEVENGKLVNASFMTWKIPSAAGAVCATASDLVKWQTALDDGGVISKKALSEMRSPTVLNDGTPIDYGLGTRIGSFHGHRVFGHTGGGGGFNTILEDFPDDHLTIVVLTNTGHAYPIAAAVARVALGLPKPELRDIPLSKADAAALPGKFDSDEGPVEQFVRDGRLRYRIPGQSREFPILRETDGTFALDDTIEIRYLVRKGRAAWAFCYEAGLLLDPKPRTSP
jgi:CubicO group peptidase (beta-lactamase class C family)